MTEDQHIEIEQIGDMSLCHDQEKVRKVGRRYPSHKEGLTYGKVPHKDGWVDASNFQSGDFDLVRLRTSLNRTLSGWHTGSGWDGLKLQHNEEVLYWKRALDLENT